MKLPVIILSICCSLLLVSLRPCPAMNLAACHCFRDRSYDPADRFAADDYLLATSYNSLISNVFNISKGEIISKKMQDGVQGNDLLTALYLATTCGRSYPLLLSIRSEGGSWQQIATSACSGHKNTDPVLTALAHGDDPGKMSRLITSFMLNKRYPDAARHLTTLQKQVQDTHRLALILALADQLRMPPEQILHLYRDKNKSFAQIAHEHGLTPENVSKGVLSGAR